MVLIDCPPPYVCISERRVRMNHYQSALQMKKKRRKLGQVVPEERGTGAGGRMGSYMMLPLHFISPRLFVSESRHTTWQWTVAISPGS